MSSHRSQIDSHRGRKIKLSIQGPLEASKTCFAFRLPLTVEADPRVQGFTLIELLVTLAISAILLTVAVPAYQTFVANTELTTTTNDLIAALNLVRSEALKRDTTMSLQSSTGDTSFSQGYCMVAGDPAPGNCTNALRNWAPMGSNVTMTVSGATSNITFDGLGGLTPSQAVVFDICRADEDHRSITVSVVGRPKLSSADSCPS